MNTVMFRCRHFSIRAKLFAGFAAAFGLLAAIGIVGVLHLGTHNDFQTRLVERILPKVGFLADIDWGIARHRLLGRQRMETADPRRLAEIDDALAAATASIDDALTAYSAIAESAGERARLRMTATRWSTYEVAFGNSVGLAGAGDGPPGSVHFEQVAIPALESMRWAVDELKWYSRKEVRGAALHVRQIYNAFFVLSGSILLLAAVGIIVGVIWAERSVSKPLRKVSAAMRRLIAGDETAVIEGNPHRADEVGTLVAAATGYRESLVTQRELARQANLEREWLEAIMRNMPIGVAMFDGHRRLIASNDRYAEMYALPPMLTRRGTPVERIFAQRTSTGHYTGDDPDAYIEKMLSSIAHLGPGRDILQLRNGVIVSVVYQPMDGGGWVSTHEDVTDRWKAEKRIAHMARHDLLTDLSNRILFHENLNQALEAKSGPVAVLCLDLDRFKHVNDTLGHCIGDGLLRAVAERLMRSVRNSDTVSRLGGDEFAIIQVGAEQPDGVRRLAQRIIESLGKPYQIDGHQLVISVSVGIAIAPADGNDSDQLLRHADMALYRAKADGRGIYRFFEPEMNARMQIRQALETDLGCAIARNQFELVYQPQIRLVSGRITGFEALLRWNHPERGVVPPNEFISVAEETGLIFEIGQWVLSTACRDAFAWPSDVRVAVNLSPAQFRNPRLMDQVVQGLSESNLPPSRLELEITESALLSESAGTLSTLHQFRALGIRIAMDDFGTGYSSLSNLQRFPFHKIKIDRRFISQVGEDSSSLAIIRAVTGLSESLAIETTAEGIETQEQLDRARSEGCTEVQGFFIGRPMPLDDANALLAERHGAAHAA